jgi:regulator of sirC expression with transglutaminase-like and TPR domain
MVKLALLAAAIAAAEPYSYETCLKKADRHPEVALEMAMNALVDGDGDDEGAGAEHCAAVALVGLKQYGEAARRLDKLARKASAGGAEVRAALLGQAGNAWILAGQPALATASFTAALALMPGEAEYLIDRARASAAQKKWAAAETDLSAALVEEPGNATALVLRSSARRAQKNLQGAMGDITQAMILDDQNAEALVERGLIRAAQGDKAGARKDFLAVLNLAASADRKVADGAREAAVSARIEIEKLEMKKTR